MSYNMDNFNQCPISFLPAGDTVSSCIHKTRRSGKEHCWVFDKDIPTDCRVEESCRAICKKYLFAFLYQAKTPADLRKE